MSDDQAPESASNATASPAEEAKPRGPRRAAKKPAPAPAKKAAPKPQPSPRALGVGGSFNFDADGNRVGGNKTTRWS